jgi:hypothetical protein
VFASYNNRTGIPIPKGSKRKKEEKEEFSVSHNLMGQMTLNIQAQE